VSSPRILVGDIGGTHARFALAEETGIVAQVTLASVEFDGLASAVRAALERLSDRDARPGERPLGAAIAVAGPLGGDHVELTNVGWSFSRRETAAELGFGRFLLLNDMEAVAWSLAGLEGEVLEVLRAGEAVADAPRAVLGLGTGLGVAAIVAAGGIETPLATEGGHRDLAATTEREWAVVEQLAQRFGHASAERALSGPGLAAIHRALRELSGGESGELAPEEVTRRAAAGSDPAAVEAARLFSGWLGAVAGDLALTFGARGGVYLSGSMLENMGTALDRDRLRERFVAKGRFRSYLAAIPLLRVRIADAGLRGGIRAFAAARG